MFVVAVVVFEGWDVKRQEFSTLRIQVLNRDINLKNRKKKKRMNCKADCFVTRISTKPVLELNDYLINTLPLCCPSPCLVPPVGLALRESALAVAATACQPASEPAAEENE